MNIALFDLDGTITTKDTLKIFIQYFVGKPKYYLGLIVLSPILILYFLKTISNETAKQILFSYFFKNTSESNFRQKAEEFSLKILPTLVRKKALSELRKHNNNGNEIVIVSASIEHWITPWATTLNANVIGTKIEFKNGMVTGRFQSKNCYGKEKVNRIRDLYQLNNYEKIYAYGDSVGDKEMLSIANNASYKPFQ